MPQIVTDEVSIDLIVLQSISSFNLHPLLKVTLTLARQDTLLLCTAGKNQNDYTMNTQLVAHFVAEVDDFHMSFGRLV